MLQDKTGIKEMILEHFQSVTPPDNINTPETKNILIMFD